MSISIYLTLGFLFLVFLLGFWVFLSQLRMKSFSSDDRKYIVSHWKRIISISTSDPRHAVLDADKLLDYVLSKKGFSGTLGEKLKKAGPRFADLNGLWSAHKLRNKIAHELSEVKTAEVQSALRSFKRALNDLGAKL